MKEYIEREDAVKHLKSRTGQFIDDVGKGWNAGIEASISYIEGLPAADVAPVVRCRECIHKGKEGENIVFCDNFERDMMPDDFCSAGERE